MENLVGKKFWKHFSDVSYIIEVLRVNSNKKTLHCQAWTVKKGKPHKKHNGGYAAFPADLEGLQEYKE